MVGLWKYSKGRVNRLAKEYEGKKGKRTLTTGRMKLPLGEIV